ncbi:proton-conducting transporter membrane subunit [Solirubrobacter ginsenosidimutans]|uniref:Proton-conducting transporter membrane subunit n=1 Tax=Solirubrobacter ginsenosidimutans TaxID=490573 RepID=A0A9X3S1R7_9ACTN|nr:proton-conducting transporter membrane subunit [Solirubrobacter ginsenosidimutans]MDA0163740.1 proton-conducting transporter membrane subunit [Solirubrobacter ginsenosidimutans]
MTELAALVPLLAAAGAALVCLGRTPRDTDRLNVVAACVTAAAALALAVTALAHGAAPAVDGRWLRVDGASGVFVAVIAVVGLCSALVSPGYLRTSARSWFTATRSRRAYYAALHLFWAALLLVPLIGNLAVAWLVVEATTAVSALLVAFTGRRDALEAGWKYLVLTTLGLSLALLGIIVVAAGQAGLGHTGLHALDWRALERANALPHDATLVAFLLIVAGLATKIGWAPVHNWLPDAHSEAPAPISALLSAALLPTVVLVAWRAKSALQASVGAGTAGAVFIGFGLASMIVAIPFLWRQAPWKRLLAYSSLEHMGVIALGIGFGTPLAIAGVLIHVAGHALAKALGFYAALPLLRADPEAATHAPAGVANAATATAMSVSLIALAGLPPSPLFVSELLIALGGVAAGETAVVAVAVVALALGFLGLLHALIEGVIGDPVKRLHAARRSERQIAALTVALGAGLLALTAAATLVPGSALVDGLL